MLDFSSARNALSAICLETIITFQNLQTIGLRRGKCMLTIKLRHGMHINSSLNEFAEAEQKNLQKSYYQFQEFSNLQKLNFQSILSMKEHVSPLLML